MQIKPGQNHPPVSTPAPAAPRLRQPEPLPLFGAESLNHIPDRHHRSSMGHGKGSMPLPLFPGLPGQGFDPREFNTPGLRQRCYQDAWQNQDARRLVMLAEMELENPMMPDTHAKTLLTEAYQVATRSDDSSSLARIATLENKHSLLSLSAGDILKSAYFSATRQQDANGLVDVAIVENESQLMPSLKAGDILKSAYLTAVRNQDPMPLIRMAQYEGTPELMPSISPERLMTVAQQMPNWGSCFGGQPQYPYPGHPAQPLKPPFFP